MSRVVRVRYEKGVLNPLEKLELSEGEYVLVIIKRKRDSLVELARSLRREAKVDIDRLVEEVRRRGKAPGY